MKGELKTGCLSMLEVNMLVKTSAKEINDIWLRNVVATVNLIFIGMKDDKT